ncbi:MAG: glycosyltransferase [Prevotella sp.]|nr:glycosyltransferase [Prevotella sp.]
MQRGKALFIGFKRHDSILVGGGVANMRCLKALRTYFGDENVTEYYILDEANGRSLWSYAKAVCLFPFDYHNGLTPKKVQEVVEMSKDFDFVFLSTSVVGLIAKKLKESGYKGKIITHYHNVESIYYDAQMPRWLPGRQVVVRCAAHNDEYGWKYSDKTITLSSRDANYLEKHYGGKADAIIGVAMEDKFRPVDEQQLTSKKPLCLFLGAYSKPNNDGVLFFVKEVLPHVDINFKVVGKGMAKLQEENECMKDIEVISDAPDLRPYFEEADFMILPIFSGSGMKIKTCESLMYGKNILGSDETFEGYEVDTDKVGGRCNTADDYICALKNYSENPIPRFNKYSREIYLKNHSEERHNSIISSVFSE